MDGSCHTHMSHTHIRCPLIVPQLVLAALFTADGKEVIGFVCVRVRVCVCTYYIGFHERWGAGVEYYFQEFNEPYAPS